MDQLGRVAMATAEEYACAQAWVALSAAHGKISGQLAVALSDACGLSINEFEILLRLDHAPGKRLRPGELNAAIPLTQPALSRAVTRLSDRGWLVRTEVADDGRGVHVVLTTSGAELLRRAIPVHAESIRAMFLDRISAQEQDALAKVLLRVSQAVD